MRRSLWIIAVAVIAVVMSSCSAMFSASSYGSSDLYNTDNRVQVANRLKAEAEAKAAEAAARQAQWEARTAEAYANAAEAEYYAAINESPNYVNIVADNYDSAYARRIYGFNSPTYNYPSSYYSLQYSNAMRYASAYDPAYYNIMVSGNQVWVEPRYVTSMFGSWGATNITYGIYSSPWNYGWSINVSPFYYSWWGYPRYSWYDWNWNVCYNPYHRYYDWWGYPYYYGHNHCYHHYYTHGHHYNPPRPPQHRPDHNRPGYERPNHGLTTGSGASAGRPIANLNGNRDNTGSRYTSPTSNRNYGKVETTTRPNHGGSVSTGVNSNSNYRVSGTKVDIPTATAGGVSNTVRDGGTRNNNSSVTTITNTGRSNNYRQGGTSNRSSGSSSTVNSSSSSKGTVKATGGSTSTRRSSGTTSSSSYRSSNSSSSSYRSSSSSSSSSYRSASSSRGTTTVGSVGNHSVGSSSRSSSSSSSSSRSGGSTSSRR